MALRNSKEVFVMILSDAHKNCARSARAFRQLSEAAESFELKQELEARAFITDNDVKLLDHCFERIGEKPLNFPFRLEDALAHDFKSGLAQIQAPAGRQLYILVKATELGQHSIAEYPILISAAEVTGSYVVGALLKTILAHKLAFMDEDRRLVRDLIKGEIAESGRLTALQTAA